MFAPNPVAAGARCTISTEVDALTNNLSADGSNLRGQIVEDRRHRQNRRRRDPGATYGGQGRLAPNAGWLLRSINLARAQGAH
jgi:hypothetical protein